ncbi:VOC family protein [Candidatus Poribacteria bacterium]|nr:VOC family protein [Candidatus Poribacteria bacterium]
MINSVNILDHVAVTVSDMDRSLAFYCDLLGLKEVERHRLEGETISKMAGKPDVIMEVVRLEAPETPGVLLDLQQYVTPEGEVSDAQLGDVAHAHFCFGVPDVWAAYKDLSEKGVEFVSEPVSFDLEWGIVYVVFFKDPDGFILELMQVPIEKKGSSH